MDLGGYFDRTKGRGVLATADASGKVNAAVYSRPYFTDETTAVFIMAERLTHENTKTNPYAIYLFMEAGEGYTGKRIYLKKIKEEMNEQLAGNICRKCDYSHYNVDKAFVVSFTVEKVLPLVGSGT